MYEIDTAHYLKDKEVNGSIVISVCALGGREVPAAGTHSKR